MLDKFLDYANQQKENTITDFVQVVMNEEGACLMQSKILGSAYWEDGMDYPVDEDNKPMTLFAQINFADMPVLENYPTKGILQWFISTDSDAYGYNLHDGTDQKNYRVVFWQNPTIEKSKAILFDKNDAFSLPASEPKSITFNKSTEYCGGADYQSETLYSAVFMDMIKNDEVDWADDFSVINSGHKIGGYAYFTQNDPRPLSNSNDEWLLLLQIDTGDDIMWGDCGVGQLFIKKTDLLKQNFSKVLYNWDCC